MMSNLAVVVWSGLPLDDGVILHMSGRSIEGLLGPGGIYSEKDSDGCTAAPLFSCPGMPCGISIWEGEISDEAGFIATGTYRRPTLAELASIVEGISPWKAREQMAGNWTEIQDHLRTCIECEVVMNASGQPRILACGWWYERGIMPPWPLPDAVPGPVNSRG